MKSMNSLLDDLFFVTCKSRFIVIFRARMSLRYRVAVILSCDPDPPVAPLKLQIWSLPLSQVANKKIQDGNNVITVANEPLP